MREEAESPAAEPSASERDSITSEAKSVFKQSVFTLWEYWCVPRTKKVAVPF